MLSFKNLGYKNKETKEHHFVKFKLPSTLYLTESYTQDSPRALHRLLHDMSILDFPCLQGLRTSFSWCTQWSPLAFYAFWLSILKLHSSAIHNTAHLHLTSVYNVLSVETEEGFTQTRLVVLFLLKASILWLVFLWTIWHFHPVAFSVSPSLSL